MPSASPGRHPPPVPRQHSGGDDDHPRRVTRADRRGGPGIACRDRQRLSGSLEPEARQAARSAARAGIVPQPGEAHRVLLGGDHGQALGHGTRCDACDVARGIGVVIGEPGRCPSRVRRCQPSVSANLAGRPMPASASTGWPTRPAAMVASGARRPRNTGLPRERATRATSCPAEPSPMISAACVRAHWAQVARAAARPARTRPLPSRPRHQTLRASHP